MKQFMSVLAFAYKAEDRKYPTPFKKELWIPPLITTRVQSRYSGSLPVLYTNDPGVAEKWAKQHFLGSGNVAIGWDMETAQDLPWRKAIYEGPATIQISVTEAALVLQIAQEGFGPNMGLIPLLSDVLSDKSILKAGVGLDQDLGELFRWPNDDGGNMVGRFDLGGIGGSYSSTTSLKNLAKTICGVELPKSRRLATSNWAQSPQLSNEQIAYAARDAWVAAAVLEELSARDKKEFSCENLLQRVLAIELPIDTLVEKAQARKEARAKLQSMLSDGNELLDRKDLTREQLSSVREVEQVIRDLKPPHPLVFDIKPLGFT